MAYISRGLAYDRLGEYGNQNADYANGCCLDCKYC